MAERNKLASIPGQPLPERQSNFLSDLWDEAKGSFARYGRRSGAQRDASLALMSQAADPNTDPLTGAGMKALGLAGLVTHPLAFFPTREEWDQRLQAAGNDSRIGRSIGGFLSDLPSLIDPQMAAGGAALAAAPIVGKMAKPGLGKGLGELLQDTANNKELDALGARLQAEAVQTGGLPSAVSREQALQGLVGGDKMPSMKPALLDPNQLTFRESSQHNLDEVSRLFPKSDEMFPIVVVKADDGESLIIDGHNRASVARTRGDKVPAVSVNMAEYKALKDAGFDDMQIAYAVLGRNGQADAADGIASKFPGAESGFYNAENKINEILDSTGGAANTATRDEALQNLVGEPQRKQMVTQSYKETLPDGTTRWVPGTLRANPTTAPRFEPSMSIADIRRYIEQFGEPPPSRAKGEIVTGKRKDVYPDGTVAPVPGLLRTKRPNNK